MRFCLTAHYHQAQTILRRIQEAERLYVECTELAERTGLPERSVGALAKAAFGFRIQRGRFYVAGQALQDLYRTVRAAREPKDLSDPFAQASQQLELALD